MKHLSSGFLVALSFAGVLVAHLHIVPTKITVLGLELTYSSQLAFVIVLSAIIAYFISMFALYGFADYVQFRTGLYIQTVDEALKNIERALSGTEHAVQAAEQEDQTYDDLLIAVRRSYDRVLRLSRWERPLGKCASLSSSYSPFCWRCTPLEI